MPYPLTPADATTADHYIYPSESVEQRFARSSFKTVGDCPDFAQSSEQNGTVPFSETVLNCF